MDVETHTREYLIQQLLSEDLGEGNPHNREEAEAFVQEYFNPDEKIAYSPTEFLEMSADRIRDPKHWTTGAYAKAANGDVVHVFDECADKFCFLGTMKRTIAEEKHKESAYNILSEVILNGWQHYYHLDGDQGDEDIIVDFNDDIAKEHSEVMDIFNEAINVAKEREYV